VARSRPSSNNGRRPEDRATTPNASIRRSFPVLRPALSKSAGLATFLFHSTVGGGTSPSQIGMEARRNRRAPGASSGELHGSDGRLRPEMPCCPPVGGDRQIAYCSAANRGTVASGEPSASICVICGFFGCDGGRSSCLRVFVFLCLRCFVLCFSLCLCGSEPSRETCSF